MLDFFVNVVICTLAIYGLIEIVKSIYYIATYRSIKSDGIYLIIATKNQEKQIEGFLRNFLFRIIYGKEDMIKKIVVTDLGSNDRTKDIVDKIGLEYKDLKSTNWKECKEIMENINEI